jgi:hypothetical protein
MFACTKLTERHTILGCIITIDRKDTPTEKTGAMQPATPYPDTSSNILSVKDVQSTQRIWNIALRVSYTDRFLGAYISV